MVCSNCDRADCGTLTSRPPFQNSRDEWVTSPMWGIVYADCCNHTVNWRERALAAEAKLARVRSVLSPECNCGCTDAFCRLETRIYAILNDKETQ